MTLRFGWRATRQSCRAMGRGGALLREVAKLEKFEGNTTEILGKSFWDVQQLSAAVAAALITCTRGEVGHAMVQVQISGGTGCVDGETYIAKAYQERE